MSLVGSLLPMVDALRGYASTLGARPYSMTVVQSVGGGDYLFDPDAPITSTSTTISCNSFAPHIVNTSSKFAMSDKNTREMYWKVVLTPKFDGGGFELPENTNNSSCQYIIKGPNLCSTGIVCSLVSCEQTATKVTLILRSSGKQAP